jgi:hypothetical protein
MDKKIDSIRNELHDFKSETGQNFENTNKLLDQAFVEISRNIPYQDKINQIDKIIHSRHVTFA